MASPKIDSFCEVTPLVYSWMTPDIPKYAGWEKIGYTEQESAGLSDELCARLGYRCDHLGPIGPGRSGRRTRIT